MVATKERLTEALRKCAADDPKAAEQFEAMAKKAAEGYYDDYESELAMPIGQLMQDLKAIGTRDAMYLRRRAIGGEFDGTAEEAQAWAKKVGLEK